MDNDETLKEISQVLSKQIDKKFLDKKYAMATEILKFVGAGLFLASSFAIPNLPKLLTPFFNENEKEAYKRFNIPYLKRTLARLEKQKLVETYTENGCEVVKITESGKEKILRMSLNELIVEKPKEWNGKWWLVSYDIPNYLTSKRKIVTEYLKVWKFFPLQRSLFLHAYPCKEQVNFLKMYLRLDKYIRIIKADYIENDNVFRDFFGV